MENKKGTINQWLKERYPDIFTLWEFERNERVKKTHREYQARKYQEYKEWLKSSRV